MAGRAAGARRWMWGAGREGRGRHRRDQWGFLLGVFFGVAESLLWAYIGSLVRAVIMIFILRLITANRTTGPANSMLGCGPGGSQTV